MRSPLIFLISALLILSQFACEPPQAKGESADGEGGGLIDYPFQLNDDGIQQIVEGITTLGADLQEKARPNKVQAWVDKLVVKAQPGKDMPQITLMNEGEVAEYLYQRTVSRSEYNLRGQRFYEPWILIRTQDGQMGWVHEGGVRYMDASLTEFLDQLAGTNNSNTAAPAPNMRVRGTGVPQAAKKEVTPAQDRLVIPGRQVGAIKLNTSETELIQIFGANQVGRSTVVLPDKSKEECTVVFGGSNDEIRITWKGNDHKSIKAVYFDRPGAKWFTRQGLHVGISLSELVKANKSPLNFYGFNWEYGGTVSAWRNGLLKSYDRHFYVVLNPGIRGKVMDQFQGNKVFSSNDKGIEALQIYVQRVVVYLD
ncbi:MAG: hypothetical protein AAFN10_01210 [Bacteroidota bacterium]